MHRETGAGTVRGTSPLRRTEQTGLGKPDHYRRFARACLEMAEDARDRRVQALMIHMAQVWVRLAQEREAVHQVQEVERQTAAEQQ